MVMAQSGWPSCSHSNLMWKRWNMLEGPPEAVEIASRSFLNGALMHHLIRVGKQNDFAEISDMMLRIVTMMWEGLHQTIIVERGNQVLRDTETRDTHNKVVSRTKRWEALQCSKLATEYKRSELPLERLHTQTSDDDMGAPFAPTSAKAELDLESITKAQDWKTFTRTTMKQVYGDRALMLEAFTSKNYNLFEKAWMSAVIPEGQIIIIRAAGETQAFYNLEVQGPACLMFPLHRVEGNKTFVEFDHTDPAARNLQHKAIADLDKVFVVPTQLVSPLHALVMKKKAPATKAGVQLKIVDKPIPVLQFQATKEFGGVPETSMKKLYQHAL